ncbi:MULTISPECIES: YqzL family protein [Geomicrobium]|uniref:YqzL family protein n=1 Tax=Geomicrobium sediminis TaxID=1347788 RepID=A0ABS2PEB3_9BACL|nr:MULTISPECIES: YqzL family protein [Geomicrobium]MBM7633750.1 hypothetical protein [Geomicrobium sediminis]
MLSYWKLFSLTGNLDSYLLHKENECVDDGEESLHEIEEQDSE